MGYVIEKLLVTAAQLAGVSNAVKIATLVG